jgi:hypothetical protein
MDQEMKYLVFDLDQTLADVSLVYFFLVSLTIKDYIRELQPYMLQYFPEDLEHQLKVAYQLFVKRIAEAETSERPIGILRPGILNVMKRITRLPHLIKHVAIYSNNQYLPSIEFVRDLIHHIHRPIIGTCIHWDHPMRTTDHESQPYVTKTWDSLKSILRNGSTDLIPKNVYFFDDQNHIHLQMTLQENYYKVPIYKTHDSYDRISEIYASCIEDAKVNIFNLGIHLADVLNIDTDVTPSMITRDLLNMLQSKSRSIDPHFTQYAQYVSQAQDRGIQIMNDVIDDIRKENLIRGRRRTLRTRRYTIKKTSLSVDESLDHSYHIDPLIDLCESESIQ